MQTQLTSDVCSTVDRNYMSYFVVSGLFLRQSLTMLAWLARGNYVSQDDLELTKKRLCLPSTELEGSSIHSESEGPLGQGLVGES